MKQPPFHHVPANSIFSLVTHIAFLPAIAFSYSNEMAIFGTYVFIVTMVSVWYHSNPADFSGSIDRIIATGLAGYNLWLLLYSGPQQPAFVFWVTLTVLAPIALFLYLKQDEVDDPGLLDWRHGLWHILSGLITLGAIINFTWASAMV
jgi:hypothetical protein